MGFRLSQEMYSLHYNTFVLYVFSHFFTVITESNLKDTRLNRKRPPTLVSSDATLQNANGNLHGNRIPSEEHNSSLVDSPVFKFTYPFAIQA